MSSHTHEPSNALSIALLGEFRVVVGDRVIASDEWQPRRAGDLVKLLALARGHRLRADEAMEKLWPDADPEAAARNLNIALHRARHLLEPDLKHGPASAFLRRTSDDLLCLVAPGGLRIDVNEFQSICDVALATDQIEPCLAALRLYRGGLLPDDNSPEWAWTQTETLRGRYLDLLAALAQRYTQRGQMAEAVETLRRMLQTDPARESAHVGLMGLYARMGQRYQALRQYQQLCQAMRLDLDTEPSPASQRLSDAIRTGAFPPNQQQQAIGDAQVMPPPDIVGRAVAPESLVAGVSNAPTRFIGRARELRALREMLATARLITLRGGGGCGKTRLAVRIADEVIVDYPDGVWMVELASITDGRLVPQAVAAVLGLRETPGRSLSDALVETLHASEALLVLDNCEHLIEAVAALVRLLLARCPRLRILTTSRRSLGIQEELVWRTPSMSTPDPDHLPPFERLDDYDAIRLFVARAAAHRASFALTPHNAAAVVRICHRLDGIPLAIELAAARLRLMTADQLAERLNHLFAPFSTEGADAPRRNQTLAATIAWSDQLLAEPERMLLRRLAVFAGGWTLEAAEEVCAGAGINRAEIERLLEALVDASLVIVDDPAPAAPGEREPATRQRMLEMTRQYAWARPVETDQAASGPRRHALWCLGLAEAAEPHFASDQLKYWLERLDDERDNLRAALAWAAERGEIALGLRLVGAVWRYWYDRGLFVEGRRWLELFLALDEAAGTPAPSLARAKTLLGIGQITMMQGDLARTRAVSEACVRLAQAHHFGRELSTALALGGGVAEYRGEFDEATRLQYQSLEVARAYGDTWRIAIAFSNLADVAREREDYAQAAAWYEECLALARQIRDVRSQAMSLTNLGHVALLRGDPSGALPSLETSLALFRSLGDVRGIGDALVALGHAACELNDRPTASLRLRECIRLFHAADNGLGLATALEGLAIYGAEPPERATRLLAAAAMLRTRLGMPLSAKGQPAVERTRNALRTYLGEHDFNIVWAVGQAVPLEQIVAEMRTGLLGAAGAPRALIALREGDGSAPLTRRERQVAELVAQGLKDREIAEQLGMQARTAETHVSHVLNKLNFASREALAEWWHRTQESSATTTEA